MEVLTHFESGSAPQYWVDGDVLYLDLREKRRRMFHVRLRNTPPAVTVRLVLAGEDSFFRKTFENVGLLTSQDGELYTAQPYQLIEAPFPGEGSRERVPMLEASASGGGDIWISNTFPYERTRLSKLIVDTVGTPNLSVNFLGEKYREFPVFCFESSNPESSRVHYFVCGEDAWESGAIWFAEYLIRQLAEDDTLRNQLTKHAEIRIIPTISPYSLDHYPDGIFRSLEGKNPYAAAHYTRETPPVAIAEIRSQINELIAERRLGFMTTVHSWAGSRDHHGFETIRTAGDFTLDEARYIWVQDVVEQLMKDTGGQGRVADKIWYEGLARDYFLREHGVATFRLEVSLAGRSLADIQSAAQVFLQNLSEIEDWRPVYPNEAM